MKDMKQLKKLLKKLLVNPESNIPMKDDVFEVLTKTLDECNEQDGTVVFELIGSTPSLKLVYSTNESDAVSPLLAATRKNK